MTGTGVDVFIGQDITNGYTPWVEQRRNLVTHPSFETSSGTVEVRRNLHPNPINANPAANGVPAGSTAYNGGAGDAVGTYGVSAGWLELRPTSLPSSGSRFGVSGPIVTLPSPVAGGTMLQLGLRLAQAIPAGLRLRFYVDAWRVGESVPVPPHSSYHTAAGRITVSVALPTGTWDRIRTYAWLEPTGTSWSGTATIPLSWWMIEVANAPGPEFYGGGFNSGQADPDLSPSWTGTVSNSPSILTGVTVPGVTAGANVLAIRSTRWAKYGTYSLRIIPTGPLGASSTHIVLNVGADDTDRGTALLTAYLDRVATLPPLLYWNPSPQGELKALVNAVGEQEVRTYDIPRSAASNIVLNTRRSAGQGDIWIDGFARLKGEYDGSYFDGATNPGGELERTRWISTANASASVVESREVIYLQRRLPHWSSGAYSIVEDSTPIDPADSTGGYGQITTVIYDEEGARDHDGKRLDLVDGQQGETTGTITGASGNGISATLTADSRLALTAVTRQAQPVVGTLGGALRYYLGLCGITSGIVIDTSLESIPVKLIGWNAVVYDQLKKLGPAHGFEMSLVSNNIVFRPVRGRVTVDYRDASVSWAQDGTNLAQAVEGYSYTTTSGTKLVYPTGGWNEDVTVYNVDAGSTTVLDLPLEASLSSVEQPTCVAFVDRLHDATSVYSVSGKDGIAIQPGQWTAGGGSVKVEIGEDTRSLKVTITASVETEYAPYSIAVSAGPSDMYSSLRIRGTGVFYSKKLMTLPACLDADRAPQKVGATVDNEFFENEDQLHHALLHSAARFSSPRLTINVTSGGINRIGDSGSARYPTIGDVESIYGTATIGTRYTQLGPTIGDWNEQLFATVRDDFENQAFGNVNGARTQKLDSWYRIRSATIGPKQISYSAEWDMTIGDAPQGETIGQWNARWGDAGKTIGDYNRAPLAGA